MEATHIIPLGWVDGSSMGFFLFELIILYELRIRTHGAIGDRTPFTVGLFFFVYVEFLVREKENYRVWFTYFC